MQYNSWLYLFPFLGGSIILYYLIPVKRRWIGLLFSSLLFYILAMKNLVAVVLFTTATIYLGARTIEEFNEQFKLKKKELDRAARKELKSKITKKNRYVIALLCVINFGILFITKYFNFFGENINALLCTAYFRTDSILRYFSPTWNLLLYLICHQLYNRCCPGSMQSRKELFSPSPVFDFFPDYYRGTNFSLWTAWRRVKSRTSF